MVEGEVGRDKINSKIKMQKTKLQLKNKNWQKVKLGEIAILNPSVHLEKGEKYPFVSMEQVEIGKKYICPSEIREYKGGGTKFSDGDILFARITPSLEHGKCGVVKLKGEMKVGFGSTEFFVFRGRENITCTDYLYYLSKTHKLRQTAINSMVGVSGRQRARIDAIVNYEFYLPPLNEQKRIADILSAFDEKIELNNKINKILEEMAQAIFKEWFVKFRFPGWQKVKFVDSELGKIPEGWRVGYLGELMELRKEKFKKYDEWKNLKLLDLGRFPQKSLAITSYGKGEEIKTSVIKFYKRDILFGAVRPYFHKVVIAPFDGVTNQSVFVIVPQNPEYYSFLITILFSESTINYATTVASGTKMPVVKWEDLCNMKILFPKIELIKIFEQKIRPLYEIILNNVEGNQKLSALRDLLLPKLMSGEVRV